MNGFFGSCTDHGRRAALAVMAGLVLQAALAFHLAAPGLLQAAPTRFEKHKIEEQAVEAFRRIIGLWQEELYFELYDHGMETTKARISREDFAQRMVELSWVPAAELNAKFLKGEFRFRTMVYVSARVQYRHKFNASSVFFKEHTFLLLEEAGTWRIDLIRLVRAPFA